MEQMQYLQEIMGPESLLSELLLAMPEDDLQDYADWIARMNDIDIEEEEEV